VTKAEVAEVLKAENPSAPLASLEMYAGCFVDYLEAVDNIARHGTIVAHPRTGAPIENPYFKIKVATMKSLLAFRRLKTDLLWKQATRDSPQ